MGLKLKIPPYKQNSLLASHTTTLFMTNELLMSELDHPFPRLLPVKCSLWLSHRKLFDRRWNHCIIFWICGVQPQNLIPFQNKPTSRLKTHFLKRMDFFSFVSYLYFQGRFNQGRWKCISSVFFFLIFHTSFLVLRMLSCCRNYCVHGLLFLISADDSFSRDCVPKQSQWM